MSGMRDASLADKYFTMESFHKSQRCANRFFEPFTLAYITLTGANNKVDDDNANDTLDGSREGPPTAESAVGEASPSSVTVAAARDTMKQDIEAHCQEAFEARLVHVLAQGNSNDIVAFLTQTPLYQSIAPEAQFMAVYDVKNTKILVPDPGQ